MRVNIDVLKERFLDREKDMLLEDFFWTEYCEIQDAIGGRDVGKPLEEVGKIWSDVEDQMEADFARLRTTMLHNLIREYDNPDKVRSALREQFENIAYLPSVADWMFEYIEAYYKRLGLRETVIPYLAVEAAPQIFDSAFMYPCVANMLEKLMDTKGDDILMNVYCQFLEPME